MYCGDFMLFDEAGKLEKGERVFLGDVKGRNEGWLRDTLFKNPEIIPVSDIDPTFGPLVPLCKELRTEAGQIDAVFVNERRRLTIVECKLWKNPQARREVVAQTLHYVSALSGWFYADLQRQVATALGRQGNIPFELVRKHTGTNLREPEFVDAVSRSLREGRFLVLLAGDGIREGVQSFTELVNRSATKAFTFGLIEVALYRFEKTRFAIQPRVLVETEVVTRQMTIANMKGGGADVVIEDDVHAEPKIAGEKAGGNKNHLRAWWQPVLDNMKLDDPEQEPPFWLATNNVVLNTPFPGIQLKAFAMTNSTRIGVFLSGPRRENVMMLQKYLKRERSSLLNDLPAGTEIRSGDCSIWIDEFGLESDDEKRAWIMKTMNTFANVLRPRLRKWYAETRA
jgi:hypothetical protein